MRANEADIDDAEGEIDPNHQPVAVAANVDPRPAGLEDAGVAVFGLHFRRRFPAGIFGFREPGFQFLLCRRLSLPVIPQGLPCDDTHTIPKLLEVVNRLFPFWELGIPLASGT